MTKRTRLEWQQIKQTHAEFAGTTKQFCFKPNLPVHAFYSQRHAMDFTTPMRKKVVAK